MLGFQINKKKINGPCRQFSVSNTNKIIEFSNINEMTVGENKKSTFKTVAYRIGPSYRVHKAANV